MPTTYVAVLPGINVGTSKRIRMPALKAAFVAGGAADVTTYVQSGNVVFTATGARAALVDRLERAIVEETGESVAVILRTQAELDAVVEANPFPDEEDPTRLHVIFLDRAAKGSVPATFDATAFAPEALAYGRREIYLHLPDGMGRAKLPVALTRALKGTTMTARNWRTTTRLVDLARATPPR